MCIVYFTFLIYLHLFNELLLQAKTSYVIYFISIIILYKSMCFIKPFSARCVEQGQGEVSCIHVPSVAWEIKHSTLFC